MQAFVAALGIVFVAELGDKTQLVALGFGARFRLAPVLIGVAIAYGASMLLAVVIGGVLGATLPTDAISIVGGILFLGFAAWTLRGAMIVDSGDVPGRATRPQSTDAHGEAGRHVGGDRNGSVGGIGRAESNPRIVGSVTVAMFVAELGDKTMLASATLAAQGDAVLVWLGATVGIMLAGTVGVLVGRLMGSRLPERKIAIGSALLFAVFGVALIISGLSG